MPLNTGQILNNRYRIVRLLGQGGFGAVYKAWDLNLSCACALKENTETSPAAQEQFFNEAKILSSLRHPGLPLVTDHFIVQGQGQYLVMDYIEGEDLLEMLSQANDALPGLHVLPWVEQVLDALAYLHNRRPPVVHRDIKPANIKIVPPDIDHPKGRAMLVDFGIAKSFDPLSKTIQGARAYTPGYSPLEQYGSGTTDARTDLYALGATMYTLLTGQEPPEAPQRMLRDPLIPPRQINSHLSPEIEVVILRAMENDPEERFQSAVEFKKAIVGQLPIASSQPPLATQPPAPEPILQESAVGPVVPLPPTQGPASQGVPTPRPFPWKWVGLGAGLLVGIALLVFVGGLVLRGDSGRIAFTSNRNGNYEIYVTNADGSGLTNLTNNVADDGSPAWSPDGKQIAFSSNRDGNYEIYVMHTDGSGVTRLTNDEADYVRPEWSPDGRQIAFSSDRTSNNEIYVMNADGSGQTRLTNNEASDSYPSWSPDGRQITFSSNRDGNWEIYVMNTDGSGVDNLTNNTADDWGLRWSPNGKQITFSSDRGGNFEIYVMNANGSGVIRLTNNEADNAALAWSPDGRQIAFTSHRDGTSEIYVMNADGSGLDRLTNNTPQVLFLSWSPDGRQIAFSFVQDGNNLEIYVMNTDGSGLTNMTNNAAEDWGPAWAP
jgi:Tol biopolymer transport system component